ncbi:MAG: hypothetical protein N2Z23_09430 [Pyrinomonadaceae bacterium]|nr:hypothetical protein [Pyrinomonadaceae bacterium]MCX7640644.1 hypothetical protein [Pyrinomonadaceae bacterium]MDW8305345.1 hypothetical protein [Acidobacteriota bacterium]
MGDGQRNFFSELWEGLERLLGWTHGPSSRGESLENLKTGLEYANKCLAVAESVLEFRQRPEALQRLRKSREAINATLRVIDGIQVFRGVSRVREAIEELRRIGNISRNPQRAARAFGELLSGLGELSDYLPYPANTYSKFLKESGGFFSNMLRALDPNLRWQHREDWREISRIINSGYQ